MERNTPPKRQLAVKRELQVASEIGSIRVGQWQWQASIARTRTHDDEMPVFKCVWFLLQSHYNPTQATQF